jgi:hypothetical protein
MPNVHTNPFYCLGSVDLLGQFTDCTMPHEVMRYWIKWCAKLIHLYLLVGYLLLPNQTIMVHAQENRSDLHSKAVVTLIKRLILNPLLVSKEKNWIHLMPSQHSGQSSAISTTRKKCFFLPTCGIPRQYTIHQYFNGMREILSTRNLF